MSRQWSEPTPHRLDCDDNHTKPPGQQLCPECFTTLKRLLHDVPAIVNELATALRKDVSFVPHAVISHPDEEPVVFNTAASRALDKLRGALDGDPAARSHEILNNINNQHQKALAYQLSAAMRTAHNVIDRPRDFTYLGACPQCTADLWTDRAWLTDLRSGLQHVSCHCGYVQPWESFTWRIIEEYSDAHLTEGQIVGMFTNAGKPLTRKRIEHLATRRHNPLPRQQMDRPFWRDGTLFTRKVWVYRVGDVLELQNQATQEMTA